MEKKRRIQFRINERIIAIDVEEKEDVTIDLTNDEHYNYVIEELYNHISRINETVENIFFDEILIVCSECGISLNSDEEKADGRCSQCQAVIDKLEEQNGG